MSVSPAILLISLTVGIPLMLLALGVLYHAYVYSRQLQGDTIDQHVEVLATESAEELLIALQDAVAEMRGQLASQRDTLAGMLSEPVPAFAAVAPVSIEAGAPMAAGEFVSASAGTRSTRTPRIDVAELAAQGLSDRAIAREFHIGLEEVRIARMRGFQS